ncbi:MAG: hypothetical protein ACI9CZ_001551 [Flavobacterium sp.]|jgi:hypothetical protein
MVLLYNSHDNKYTTILTVEDAQQFLKLNKNRPYLTTIIIKPFLTVVRP